MSEEYELNEEDIPEEAFDPIDGSELVFCPRSNEEVFESPKAYSFSGYDNLACWKVVSQRKISPSEYAESLKAFEEGQNPPIYEGFISKEKKPFKAGLLFDETQNKFKFHFPEIPKSSHKCPKGGEILIFDKTYGFTEYKKYSKTLIFFKTVLRKEISVTDYIEILEEGRKLIRGFYSKKSKSNFDAYLVYNEADQKIEIDFKK